jgi:hypothetical protein
MSIYRLRGLDASFDTKVAERVQRPLNQGPLSARGSSVPSGRQRLSGIRVHYWMMYTYRVHVNMMYMKAYRGLIWTLEAFATRPGKASGWPPSVVALLIYVTGCGAYPGLYASDE